MSMSGAENTRQNAETERQQMITKHGFQIGDKITVCYWSDRSAAVVAGVSQTTVTFRMCKARLLNGPNSGAPDAFKFSPGGFVGHTSGSQRWELTEDQTAPTLRATWRKDGSTRQVGFGSFGQLIHGWHHHHDFNF